MDKDNGRTHDPNLRELTNELDGVKEVLTSEIARLRDISNERDRRYEDRFKAMDEKTMLALNASEKAVTKAEIAQEKRFDNTNEWRAAMQDRDRNQMPRIEIEQRFNSLAASRVQMIGIGVSVLLGIAALLRSFIH